MELEKEYSNWLTTQNLVKLFESLDKRRNEQRVALDILERLLVTSANETPDNFFSFPKFALEKMKQELLSKKFVSPTGAQRFINDVIRDAVKVKLGEPAEPIITENGNVRYKEFFEQLPPERLALLRNTGATDDEIVQMVMRYASLAPSKQQSSAPYSLYQAFDKWHIDLEGFAFTTQLTADETTQWSSPLLQFIPSVRLTLRFDRLFLQRRFSR